MDVQSLKMLKAVADTGSFSGAARQLNFAQSHVSTQILHLEEEIGAPLFYRHNRGITITAVGETFLGYANEMIRIMDAASRALSVHDVPSGTLTIASMQTTAQSLLPELLSAYHKAYPDVCLKICTGTSEKNIRQLLDYECDLAFTAGNFFYDELVAVPLKKEKLVLLTSDKKRGDTAADILSRQPLLVFPNGCAYRKRLEEWLDAEHTAAPTKIEFDSLPAILASASAGLGTALLPDVVAELYRKKGYLYAIEPPQPYRYLPLQMVYRKDRFLSPSIKALVEIIKTT